MAQLIADLLSFDGHQTDVAPSAAAALGRMAAQRYDLVITDIRMPDMDGPHFYREVAARYPEARPQFVFMTGDLLGPGTSDFLESTRALRLAKPFDLEAIRRVVAHVFNGGAEHRRE